MIRVNYIQIRLAAYEKFYIEGLAAESKYGTTAAYCRAVLLGKRTNKSIDNRLAKIMITINNLLSKQQESYSRHDLLMLKELIHDS